MTNLVTRSISGLLFMAVIIGSLLIGPAAFFTVFLAITLIMMSEYMNIVIGKGNLTFQKNIAIIIGASLFTCFFVIYGDIYDKLSLFAIPLLLLIVLYISNLYIKPFNIHEYEDGNKSVRKPNGYETFPTIINSIFYIALPMSMLNIAAFREYSDSFALTIDYPLELHQFSGNLLICFFIIIWASDVGAYCFGTALGQKFGPKLFPSVSPKKSWIGSAGGFICALIAAWVLNEYTTLMNFHSIIHIIAIAAIINIGGAYGDLVESQLKRNFGVKDSGNIMPGHGGMLDRFDSVIIGFPLAIIYLEIFTY